jgi:topoisomerase IA-like protein
MVGRYGNIPIHILYGTYGPYLNWVNKNISIPKQYIKYINTKTIYKR